jgi:hypothetical protein
MAAEERGGRARSRHGARVCREVVHAQCGPCPRRTRHGVPQAAFATQVKHFLNCSRTACARLAVSRSCSRLR